MDERRDGLVTPAGPAAERYQANEMSRGRLTHQVLLLSVLFHYYHFYYHSFFFHFWYFIFQPRGSSSQQSDFRNISPCSCTFSFQLSGSARTNPSSPLLIQAKAHVLYTSSLVANRCGSLRASYPPCSIWSCNPWLKPHLPPLPLLHLTSPHVECMYDIQLGCITQSAVPIQNSTLNRTRLLWPRAMASSSSWQQPLSRKDIGIERLRVDSCVRTFTFILTPSGSLREVAFTSVSKPTTSLPPILPEPSFQESPTLTIRSGLNHGSFLTHLFQAPRLPCRSLGIPCSPAFVSFSFKLSAPYLQRI
ncbi:hypothetical protein IE53DRAFT_36112 [Violaceomyces palustris]|uniref:Uncharacterized protein n=1 Tax=Violaceomyces palustris TaxID=1673888 RepID=A0ACD0P101_9BASI|nr:hypothetical protein IE53DRAFT_36112 [Violaceomyces palustris]